MLILIALIIFAILLTQRPLLSVLHRQSERAYDTAKKKRWQMEEETQRRRQQRKQRRETDRAVKDRQRAIREEREANVRAVRDRTVRIPHAVVPQDLKEEARRQEELRRLQDESRPVKTVRTPEPSPIPDDIIVNAAVPAGANETFTTIGRSEKPEIPERTENDDVYVFPSTSLLAAPSGGRGGDSNEYLKATAAKLQQTLHDFGVEVTIHHKLRPDGHPL